MHKNDFFPFIFFSYHSLSLSYLELQIIFPCRDIGPATATLDPRPRHWTGDPDFGPATATLDPRPRLWTRDPRPATISQSHHYAAFPLSRTSLSRLWWFAKTMLSHVIRSCISLFVSLYRSKNIFCVILVSNHLSLFSGQVC